MKKTRLLIVVAMLTIGSASSQGGGMTGFSSESPWQSVDQGAENMDKGFMQEATEGKKASNRGGQGGAGGFASFNTNSKDVPIDSGIVFVIVFFVGFGIYQIRKTKQIAIQS